MKKLFKKIFGTKDILDKYDKYTEQVKDVSYKVTISNTQNNDSIKENEKNIDDENIESPVLINDLSREEIECFVQESIETGIYYVDNPIIEDNNQHVWDLSLDDPKFYEVCKMFVEKQQASCSLLQRNLKLGYAQALKYMRHAEYIGVIEKYNGSKNRSVLYNNINDINIIFKKTPYEEPKLTIEQQKIKLYNEKYHHLYEEHINSTIDNYKINKLNDIEKEKIKQEYLEKERKRKLREEAKKEMISEGIIKENVLIKQDERRISQIVKDQVWNRDNGKCVECGSNEKLEFDHVIPFSKGGSNTYRNIQLLCEKCNREKSNKIG